MPKIYRLNNRLVINLPSDMIAAMKLKDGDELELLKHDDYFVISKKNSVQMPTHTQETQQKYWSKQEPNEKEIALLKKLDLLRYNTRTKDKVITILNTEEKRILSDMLKKRFVILFKKQGEQEYKYSISKSIYDRFLMRKNMMQKKEEQAAQKPQPKKEEVVPKKWEQMLPQSESYPDLLESYGYIVLMNEAEALAASSALEESIRRGMVIGTRAFNKKFYVVTRKFLAASAAKLSKLVGPKGISVSELSKETGIAEDGIRAVLYIMAEAGDVTEARKDVFKEA
ncbi:AbrB/MazE/SpoVT family DNA-binding domain-containing protein [Candidatus Marsarchaeota archaeon]|nr:AbrB/MazE/SpoVT family DNA-binding domain-containing protein [Candidatus Marsarchaeota archaeon]